MVEVICKEIAEERAGICEFDGLLTRQRAEELGMLQSEAYRKACEAREKVRECFPDHGKLECYLALVVTKRGKEASDNLREDCRTAWRDEIRRANAERKAA